MRSDDILYFDSAATLLPKPRKVKEAVLSSLDLGNPGRGGHALAMRAARELFAARQTAAAHFGAESPEHVCFFSGATTALNCLIKSLAAGGSEVLISDMEHNAVRRPALSLAAKGVRTKTFRAFCEKEECKESFQRSLSGKTSLAVFLHASNVCPVRLPVRELCRSAGEADVLTVLDCSQSGGHFPFTICETGADALVFPSHKGLMGVAGAGMAIVSDRMKTALENARTLLEGGSGIHSKEEGMPGRLPERLEWGTPPLAAILSMCAGIRVIEEIGYETIAFREKKAFDRLCGGLGSIEGVTLYGMPSDPLPGPLLFTVKGISCEVLAGELFERGVCLREGFHCAPMAHETIGSGKTGGLRVSFSAFTTAKQADRFLSRLVQAIRTCR